MQEINIRASILMQAQQETWRELRRLLDEADLSVVGPKDLSDEERGWLEERFLAEIFPVLTPLAIDPAHPFPFIANLGLGMALQLARGAGVSERDNMRALMLIPPAINRFIRLPGKELRFIPVEQMIGLFLDRLFPGFAVVGQGMFRILRDSEVEVEEEAEDLVRVYESAAEAPPPRQRHPPQRRGVLARRSARSS